MAWGGRHDLRGQVEVTAEILDALVGEVPVEVSLGKLLLHMALRFKRLHGFHDMKIGHVLVVCWFGVLRHVDIRLGHHHPLLKKKFISGNPVLLGHQHCDGCCVRGQSLKGLGQTCDLQIVHQKVASF